MPKPGWGCITSSKYEQTATLLRQGYVGGDTIPDADNTEDLKGQYVIIQDPITGQIDRIWVEVPLPDDPDTVVDESTQVFTFKCQARSIITGGLNSQGTTERFTSKGTYENVDFIEMHVPKNVIITKRDRVTNIKNSRGEIVWIEEEHGKFTPTVFEVRGVSPVLDPFGSQTEWFVVLERAGNQSLSGREAGS